MHGGDSAAPTNSAHSANWSRAVAADLLPRLTQHAGRDQQNHPVYAAPTVGPLRPSLHISRAIRAPTIAYKRPSSCSTISPAVLLSTCNRVVALGDDIGRDAVGFSSRLVSPQGRLMRTPLADDVVRSAAMRVLRYNAVVRASPIARAPAVAVSALPGIRRVGEGIDGCLVKGCIDCLEGSLPCLGTKCRNTRSILP